MIEQIKYFCLAALFLFSVCSCELPESPVPVTALADAELSQSAYLGLVPPGLKAEVFLPDILADVERGTCSGFMFNGNVFIFKLLSPGRDWKYEPLYFTEFRNGSWTEPEVTPFSDLFPYNFTVAPDDKTLYFTSLRSAEDHEVILKQADVWKVEKTADGWTEPETFGPPVNSIDNFENYPSITADHTLYFMSYRDDGLGKDDIYRLELVDGEYQELENIGAPVNTIHAEVDPFISADESYLIFCSEKPGGFGGFDLYISFRKPDGTWTEPMNMGESINSAGAEFRPSVSPDQKYFFFTSDRSGVGEIFWISTDIIQSLKPSSFAYGFTAPGMEPELFAFDLLGSNDGQFAPAISPDGREIYFTEIRLQESGVSFELQRSVFSGEQWSRPESVVFEDEYSNIEAFFDSSGRRLYFFSNRPEDGDTEPVVTMNLWFMEKDTQSWGQPNLLGKPGTLVKNGWSSSLLDDSTLYFTARPHENPGLADIYEVSIAGDSFGEAKNIGEAVNTLEYTENEPAIAPDGSYMVFYSAGRPDNLSSELLGDLYISFRDGDGNWMNAIHVDPPINSPAEENWPRISPDGKFLFFSSNRHKETGLPDLYWVSTKALQKLHPDNKSAKSHLKPVDFPQLSGPYLGQQPPGMTPEIFASGVLVAEDGDAINSVFSPDGMEFYYVVLEDGSPRYNLWSTRITGETWTRPGELRLAGEYEVADIALSPDGNRLYFCSDMPTYWENAEGFDIWYVERIGEGWSKPVNAGRNINSPGGETQPSFTSDGTMYFPSHREGTLNGSVDLFFSEMINGEFMEPVRLPDSVNSEYNEGNSFIAPDGSFILFARWDMPKSIDGGKGLYISFRESDGGWTEAINTAPVLAVRGSLAALTHDGKYLLWSTPQGIHWVDMRALQQLRRG